MNREPSYSPVLWSAIAIPVVSATELFVDPVVRGSYGFFVLGSFYLVSVRYTLAVCLGVFEHDEALRRVRPSKRGISLWACYFLILLLCSLLVPGAAILGLTATLAITFTIISLSLLQGILAYGLFDDQLQKNNTLWRGGYDVILIIFLLISFQSVFVGLAFLLVLDICISARGRTTLMDMAQSLRSYFSGSIPDTRATTTGSAS